MTAEGGTADPPGPSGPLGRLLQLQADDTAADQLRHRRASLPERAALEVGASRMAEVERTGQSLRQQRDALAANQADLERQIEAARNRSKHIDQRMRSGQITAGRDLAAMDEEVRHLADHIRSLEDDELQIMEALEPLDEQLDRAEAEIRQLQSDAVLLRSALAEAEAAIDGQLEAVTAQRATIASDLPPELLTQYERIRARADGIGAARLVGNACSGCHLTLPSMEIDRIRRSAPDTVVTCDQCGRILVR
jgi:predicted  nucleic acid-binding Zn-ribbon protein